MKARYLLRFDDICPTMNWAVWDEVESILCQEKVSPILAVVPDNRDQVLQVHPAEPSFWSRLRDLQARGWTIAMHGWQHQFVSRNSGVLGVNRFSEFAGLPRYEQERKLRSGQELFAREGIVDRVFIAPAHSFDTVTLQLLRELGFRHISDGFFPLPHLDELGMLWVPQQLWQFRRRPFGVWTICFHINRWTSREISKFRDDVVRYRDSISCFKMVVDQYGTRPSNVFDSAAARAYRFAAAMKAAMQPLLPS